MMNHLWQSTLFGIAVGVLTLAFRGNRAQVRYWLWFSASVKFLVPFSVLIALGSVAPHPTRIAAPAVSIVVEQFAEPFAQTSTAVPAVHRGVDWASTGILGLWACGFAAISLLRLRGWRRVRAAVRASSAIDIRASVGIRSAPGLLEPGVVGLWRPVLLLPEGIAERLTPAQLEAVLAHELCHVRRRDNLLSAIHMIVEAAFWFHPLVWWIGARLVEERERACDEAVLTLGAEPRVFAEGILNVCKLYAESPLVCVSGVTGSDIGKRIEAIMTNRIGLGLTLARKSALAVAGLAALAAPLVVGVINAPFMRAQTAVIPPKFEVASVKLCPDGAGRGATASRMEPSPDRLELNCQPLVSLIEQAYVTFEGRSTIPIEGAPAWTNSDRYRIDAKADGPQSQQTMGGPMLRALLEDRFHLKTHRESKEVPVYLLTAAKGGAKLQRSEEGSCESDAAKRIAALDAGQTPPRPCGIYFGKTETPGLFTLNTRGMSIEKLCDNLSHLLDRPVVDKTGIEGRFDLRVEFVSDEITPALRPGGGMARFGEVPEGTPPAPGASIPIALQQQLGLKLDPAKGPREYLVIDHVEKPTEN